MSPRVELPAIGASLPPRLREQVRRLSAQDLHLHEVCNRGRFSSEHPLPERALTTVCETGNLPFLEQHRQLDLAEVNLLLEVLPQTAENHQSSSVVNSKLKTTLCAEVCCTEEMR